MLASGFSGGLYHFLFAHAFLRALRRFLYGDRRVGAEILEALVNEGAHANNIKSNIDFYKSKGELEDIQLDNGLYPTIMEYNEKLGNEYNHRIM